jgi:hypothetical protein
MDALAAAEFHPAIAIMGGSPSDEVLDFIVAKTNALGLFHWVLIPDNDNLAFTAKFVQRKEGFSVYTPSGKDLAGMPRWERTKLFAQIGRRI